MSFNGSGVFVINTTGQPVVTGTVISSSTFNTLTADLATGLTTCLTKDGQSTPTANIKLGGYKLTGLGAPTTSGDALSFGNVATISTLTLTNVLGVAYGGTGLTTPGTSGYVLTSNGSSWVSAVVNSSYSTTAKTTDFTLAQTDYNTIFSCTGSFTVTFPDSTNITSPWSVVIQNSGTGSITLARTSTNTIDGLTTYVIYPGEVRLFTKSGTGTYVSVILASFYKQFTAGGNFTDPPGYSAILCDGVGGGGGGGGAGDTTLTSGGTGGAGGARTPPRTYKPVPGTVRTVSIAAGGTAGNGAAKTAGGVGGNTTFGSLFTWYGGAGGSWQSTAAAGGGGGGGAASAGSGVTGGGPSALGGTTRAGVGLAGASGLSNATGFWAEWGGGAGGGVGNATGDGSAGGGSAFGGGGGGGGAGCSGGGGANGGAGGLGGSPTIGGGAAGGAAGAATVNGTSGAAGDLLNGLCGGGGGGGNAATTAVQGGNGGAGGAAGGGGGGAGGAQTGLYANGGAGGRGELVIYGIA